MRTYFPLIGQLTQSGANVLPLLCHLSEIELFWISDRKTSSALDMHSTDGEAMQALALILTIQTKLLQASATTTVFDVKADTAARK